jgi:chromosome segregation ATPase
VPRSQLQKLETGLRELEQKLLESKREAEDGAAHLRQELKRAEDGLHAKENELADMGEKVAELEKTGKELTRAKKELEARQAQEGETGKKTLRLKNELDDATALLRKKEDEVSDLRQELDNLTGEVEAFRMARVHHMVQITIILHNRCSVHLTSSGLQI